MSCCLQCPPGMKQVVLQLFTRLLSRISQPTLPHVHVHRPVQVFVYIFIAITINNNVFIIVTMFYLP